MKITDWVYNRSDEVAIEQGCYFDIRAADRVRYFFSRFLRHSKAPYAGKPFELLDWQWKHCIGPLFGWKRPDGSRRFRRAGVAIPKKNGKSTLLSGIGLYMLCGDGEQGAEVYSAAADRKQASIIYNESANMVEASDSLSGRIRLVRAAKHMADDASKSTYDALSAEAYTKEGLNIHCLLFDELHAQKDSKLWDGLKYGGIARRQPLIFWITTAGTDIHSLCYQQWQHALAVQESRAVDVSFFPYICAAKEEDDWTKPDTWAKANPSYGVTMNGIDFGEDCTAAQSTPANENTFKRYRLNLWTKQVTKWISASKWDACAKAYTQADQKRQRCVIGLDLAAVSDFASAVAVFKEGQKVRLLPYFWLPAEAINTRAEEDRYKLLEWANVGLIKIIDGATLDYDVIRADLNSLADIFKVEQIAIDPWNAQQLATDLEGDGFKVQFVRQGFISISSATKEYEKLVLSNLLEHNAHPVYDWMQNNVAVETDASGNIKPSKSKSSEKIDGPVAAITGLAVTIKRAEKKQSKYNTQRLSSI